MVRSHIWGRTLIPSLVVILELYSGTELVKKELSLCEKINHN